MFINKLTVNDLINAHSQINASDQINAPPPPYTVKLVLNAPCLNIIKAPLLENCPQILGNGILYTVMLSSLK